MRFIEEFQTPIIASPVSSDGVGKLFGPSEPRPAAPAAILDTVVERMRGDLQLLL